MKSKGNLGEKEEEQNERQLHLILGGRHGVGDAKSVKWEKKRKKNNGGISCRNLRIGKKDTKGLYICVPKLENLMLDRAIIARFNNIISRSLRRTHRIHTPLNGMMRMRARSQRVMIMAIWEGEA